MTAGDAAAPGRPHGPADDRPNSYRFFTPEEVRTAEAITGRIMSAAEPDPGALRAGVVLYIDAKLARLDGHAEPAHRSHSHAHSHSAHTGDWAHAATDGTVPVSDGQSHAHGSQAPPNPGEIYHLGLPALDRYSQTRFGALFASLPEERQVDILRVLDGAHRRSEIAASQSKGSAQPGSSGDGDATASTQEMNQAEDVFGELSPGLFVQTVRLDTVEGMFADPVHGGHVTSMHLGSN